MWSLAKEHLQNRATESTARSGLVRPPWQTVCDVHVRVTERLENCMEGVNAEILHELP